MSIFCHIIIIFHRYISLFEIDHKFHEKTRSKSFRDPFFFKKKKRLVNFRFDVLRKKRNLCDLIFQIFDPKQFFFAILVETFVPAVDYYRSRISDRVKR